MSFQTVLDAQDAQLLSAFDPATTSADSITSGAGSGLKSPSEPTRQYLNVPTKSSYRPRPSIDSTYSELSELSIYSDELRHSRPFVSNDAAARLPSTSPAPRRGRRATLDALWIRNKGVVLVLLSQAFGSLMNVATRILETDGAHGKAMHPFQVLTPALYVITQPMLLPADTQPSFQGPLRTPILNFRLFPCIRLLHAHSPFPLRTSQCPSPTHRPRRLRVLRRFWLVFRPALPAPRRSDRSHLPCPNFKLLCLRPAHTGRIIFQTAATGRFPVLRRRRRHCPTSNTL